MSRHRVPSPTAGRCATGKVRFKTKADAGVALFDISRTAIKPERVPVRVYRCPTCEGWHLTSQRLPRTEP